MPELPEVETMVKNIGARARGGEIEEIIIHRQNGRYLPDKEREQLLYDNINRVRRRGKFMVFETIKGLLVCHNAMSGYWDTADNPWTFDYVEGRREATEKDMRVSIHLSDGTALCFHDSRLFGSLRFYPGARDDREIKSLRDLGPEPLSGWSQVALDVSLARHKDQPVKLVLVNQNEVAGIGNIYAVEALWRSSIRPDRLAGSLDEYERAKLLQASKFALELGLKHELQYDKYLTVYRRSICPAGHKIEKIEIGKRSTYFCPVCQK